MVYDQASHWFSKQQQGADSFFRDNAFDTAMLDLAVSLFGLLELNCTGMPFVMFHSNLDLTYATY